MLDQLPSEITSVLTTKTLAWATAGWLLVQNLGRAWHAWKEEGGWLGIRNALIFGTNVPKSGDAPESKPQPK